MRQFDEWLEERAVYPSWILPSMDEPLRDDAGVSVYIFPHSDRIIPLEPSVRQRYPRRHGTPICLFAEVLTPRTAPRLRTDLAMISHLQGLSSREALAFLAQFFVMFVDSYGRESGRESLLFGPTPETVGSDSAQQGDQLVRAMNTPRFRLEQVLDLWTHISSHAAPARVYRSPDGSPGRPGYFWIPPSWLSPEKLKEIEANEPNPSKIPVLVEPQYADLTQRFADLTQRLADFDGEHLRKAGPMDIAFSGQIATLGAEMAGSTREARRTSLSAREREEFEAQGFKSDLAIQFTGWTEGLRGNILFVGGERMVLTDAPLKLLLRLAVQLQETDDGFLALADLKYGEGVDGESEFAPDGMDQALSRLRKPFAGYLEGLPTNKLIERRKGKVRLSTHRRCVTWDRERLLLHDNAAVRQLAERLPECGPPT